MADPYRWLEDVKAPQTVQWMKAASDHAAATLACMPGREALLARLKELDAGEPAWSERITASDRVVDAA